MAINVDLASLTVPAAAMLDAASGARYWDRADLRVVLDLKDAMRPKTFLLKPNAGYGHRLVVDLYPVEATRKPRVAKSAKDLRRARDVVVAVDAGHGGDDPGASGSRYKTQEKQVTLEIARRLKELPVQELTEPEPVLRPEVDEKAFTIRESETGWRVHGIAIERTAQMTNWDQYESAARFQRVLEAMGITTPTPIHTPTSGFRTSPPTWTSAPPPAPAR